MNTLKIRCIFLSVVIFFMTVFSPAVSFTAFDASAAEPEHVTLRISNWEEYIDIGDWDEDELIELDDGEIIGENQMIDDFEEWYFDTYGVYVDVEYSTFGTNEDLYNMLTLGDVYDLVCPSEYMNMKLISEDMLVPFSEDFFDENDENNYYIRGVSPYIRNIMEEQEIAGKSWSEYMAGYMWGITGIVYNPEEVSREDASTWGILANPKYRHQITIKDNVRDAYFAAVGAIKSDLLLSEEFLNDPDRTAKLEAEMNDTSPETIQAAQDYLQTVRSNAYSFETDSGKADMVTGKVLANYQWSGDAVYSLDQAEEEGLILNFAVPEEVTNIYFDGWVMLKSGIGEDKAKQHAAEAFVNFISRPDNVIRNMYFVGYTSVISGGDDPLIFEYADWCYGAEEDAEDTFDYSLDYFFSDDKDSGEFTITAESEQADRQLIAQYPSLEIMERASIMTYFDDEKNDIINNMWIKVRCFNIYDIPVWAWIAGIAAAAVLVYLFVRSRHANNYYKVKKEQELKLPNGLNDRD